MHEAISESGVLGGEKAHGGSEVFFAHGGLEISKGFQVTLGLASSPFHEEAYGQATEHTEDPQAVGIAHAAAIIVQGNVQPLVQSIFDGPALPVGGQPI